MQQDSPSRLVGRRRPKTSKEERVCPICFKDFAKAEHLARHYRSHTKEKPFPCPQCGRVYARKDTLLRHTRSHCRRDGSPEREAVSSPRIESTLEGLVAATPSDSATERPNINASSLDFSIPLAQPQPQRPIGDFQINESLDLSGIPGGELESGWISWLMDDKFDLDAVNATLLQATTGDFLAVDSLRPDEDPSPFESLEIGPQTTAPELAPSGDADHGMMDIRRKWHTHCGQAASSLISPDPVNDGNRIDHSQPDHNQIDETYRHELAKRLEQRLQTGILPSTTFLHLCLQAYFSHFHPLFPIVHEPSFVPSGQNAILLLSICSLGSLFLGSRRAIEHGISMFERLQKAALSSWDTTILQRPDSNIVTIQSALLGQTFGLLMGRPKDLMGIEAFHGSIIAFARRLRLFDHPASPELPTSVSSLSADELQLAWERWTCQEERKRTTLGIFILDAELAKMHHHEPLLRHAAERLPIIASDELFAADNANSWRVLVLQQIQRSETLTREQTCDWASNFQLSANLESISGIACECQAPFSSTHHMAQRCQEALFAWHDSHLSTASPGDDWAHPLKILWHSTFLLLFSNIDTLERACGRDGPEAAREAAGYARQWANSPEATRSILHAVCIRQHFESISIGAECSLWIPTCLYHCGIIWFSFGHFGEGKNRALPGQSFPEFELARVHLSEIVVGELNGSLDAGRKAVNQVFRIIGLLQSIRHWKLSLSLASTLLALVEGQDNGF